MEATPPKVPDPCLVELCSVAERALNYMHTGNTAVISTTIMNPLWIGNAVVQDGLPCFNKNIISLHGNSKVQVSVIKERWPYNQAKLQPKTSSSAAQIFAYDLSHFNVSMFPTRMVRAFWWQHRRTFSVQIACLVHQCSALHSVAIRGYFLYELCVSFTIGRHFTPYSTVSCFTVS